MSLQVLVDTGCKSLMALKVYFVSRQWRLVSKKTFTYGRGTSHDANLSDSAVPRMQQPSSTTLLLVFLLESKLLRPSSEKNVI